MFAQILKGKKAKKKEDGASFVHKDGSESNSDLHEQMTAGVDDSKLREITAKAAVAKGMSKEQAYGIVGLKAPKK